MNCHRSNLASWYGRLAAIKFDYRKRLGKEFLPALHHRFIIAKWKMQGTSLKTLIYDSVLLTLRFIKVTPVGQDRIIGVESDNYWFLFISTLLWQIIKKRGVAHYLKILYGQADGPVRFSSKGGSAIRQPFFLVLDTRYFLSQQTADIDLTVSGGVTRFSQDEVLHCCFHVTRFLPWVLI